MEVETFKERLKQCKKGGRYGYEDFKVHRISNFKNRFYITKKVKKNVCKHCGTDLTKTAQKIEAVFHEVRDHLTVFEVNMLWMVFKLNQVPADYANFHKSPYGEKFIKNLKEVNLL